VFVPLVPKTEEPQKSTPSAGDASGSEADGTKVSLKKPLNTAHVFSIFLGCFHERVSVGYGPPFICGVRP